MTIYAKGHNGQVTVDGDWLTIERKGLGRLGHSKGDRRIPLGSITAVQVRPAGPIANGFIRFTVPGSPELRGGLNNATSDENAVLFTKKQAADFDAVRAYIEDYIGRRMSGGPAREPAPTDVADQLSRLAALRDQGVLTDDEFAAQKAKVLG